MDQLIPKAELLNPVAQGDLVPGPPDLPNGEGHDFRCRGYGADLVLEICRNSLADYDEDVIGNAAVVMRRSQGAAVAKALTIAEGTKLFSPAY